MSMYYAVRRVGNGMLDLQMIYGSALNNTTMVRVDTQKAGVHMNYYTTKHIDIWQMRGREKNSLNLVRGKHILERD